MGLCHTNATRRNEAPAESAISKGDLSYNFVLRFSVDIVVATETWLDEMEPTFGKVRGYNHCARNDLQGRPGTGEAIWFREALQTQLLPAEAPPNMESLFVPVALPDNQAVMVCATYRPLRQGLTPLDFLADYLDELMTRHNCNHVLIVEDLNHHLEQAAYESLLTAQGLAIFVTFPTHERGGTLNPVIATRQREL